jgi:molecular chaperone DnaK (HSP70)
VAKTAPAPSTHIVGIDLGTTNSALAHIDASAGEHARSEVLAVPQLVNAGEIGHLTLLPSFLYVPAEIDFPAGSLALPWDRSPQFVIGELARRRGAENPIRLVASAKSWLSYAGVDRTAAILPWQSPPEVTKLSPVDVSSKYLQFMRDAWHQVHSASRLTDQDIVLTIPASFDEEARRLTLRAAEQADLGHVTLLEEPQAAFYAWIESLGEAWRDIVRVGDLVLVCDVGGGTTDFSLITVSEEQGELVLRRAAVGDHLLLGGDNMDLALARVLQQRLEAKGQRIDTWQLQELWYRCRHAKETLLNDAALKSQPVTIRGKGTKLVGGTLKTELTREDVHTVLVDGFFPLVERDAMPARQRRVGFQELGLPYAPDAAVTRHLARFLLEQSRHAGENDDIRRGPSGLACPTHVLFNGGVMKAEPLRARVVEVLNRWVRAEGFEALDSRHVLEARDLDLAVARGAAYYGKARRGRGIRIRAGAPRTYYIGIESAMPSVPGMPAPLKALCVVPFGMEEGTRGDIPGREFGLVVGEPAEFRFLTSTTRKQDRIGELIEDWGDDIQEISPLEVTLPGDEGGDEVRPVRLETNVTEVGTLELWCVSRDGSDRWKLEFNIRTRDQGPPIRELNVDIGHRTPDTGRRT